MEGGKRGEQKTGKEVRKFRDLKIKLKQCTNNWAGSL